MTSAPTRPAVVRDRAAEPSRAAGAPTVLVVVAAAVLLAGIAVTLLGAWRTGVSWDETYHVMRLRNLLAHGWYLLDGDLDGDRPGAWEDQRYVYGPAATLLLHAWSVLAGTEPWGGVAATAQAFAVRHLGVAALGLTGVGAAAGLTRVLLRRWSWALVTAAALVALPTWTGQSMINVKDVPVATGYTLVTLGVALLAVRRPGAAGVAAPLVLLVAGTVLAVGTRPGIWPGLALAYGLGALTRDRPRLLVLVGAGVLGLGALALVYPAAFADPVAVLVDSVHESSHFDGKRGACWYLPVFLLVELPTLMVVAGACGAVLAVRRLAAHRGDPARTVLALVLMQTFALPLVAVAARSNLYTGLRQLLFAAPGLAVLVTLALAALLAHPARWRCWLAGGVLVVPLAAQAALFPYSYAYSSGLATLVDPVLVRHDARLEVQTDYWRTSVRELAPRLPADGFVVCSPTLSGGIFWRRSSESADDCATSPIGPLAPYADRRSSRPAGIGPTEFLAVRTGNGTVGSNCTRLGEVTRRLYWRRVVMSTVSRCDLPLPAYPAGGMTFDGAGAGAGYLLGGWSLHHTRPGAVLGAGHAGELGFLAPAGDGALVLTGTAIGLAGATLEVDGRAVPLEIGPGAVGAGEVGAWRASVPAHLLTGTGEGRVLLRLRAGSRGLHLLSLTASRAG